MPGGSSDHAKQNRVIMLNGPQISKFPTNMITMTKYNAFTFLPFFLMDQFQNYTNCFFLIIIIIQQIPGVSPIGSYTTLLPFMFILTVSAAKEIMEDYKRYQRSKAINYKRIEILVDNHWVKVRWKDINVGDIVRVYNNEYFPADLLFVASSNPEAICYIETVNLDGESNLKVRRGVPHLLNLSIPEGLSNFGTSITCDPPNEMIYEFSGSMKTSSEQEVLLNFNQLLLRGALLKNTEWVVGIAIYTGHDTKIMKNANPTPLKRSTLLSTVNYQIIILFVIFIILIISNGLGAYFWKKNSESTYWYMNFAQINDSIFRYFLSFVILYSFIIPISLQVSLEIVRYFQVIFINRDIDMYYEKTNTWAIARTSNLNEDLGMVRYIFSDKTGTLTQNMLEFKGCTINGTVYMEEDFKELQRMVENEKASSSSLLHHFFICICICNNVIPVKDGKSTTTRYYAASPDEKALIMATARFGYSLYSKKGSNLQVKFFNSMLQFEILAELEFTSERRRSSVIVRAPNNKLYIYVMGADDAINPILSNTSKHVQSTFKNVQHFALLGFRTLCIGMAELNEHLFSTWYRTYSRARISLSQKQTKFNHLANEMERNILLLGATAVEDKLQDDVPETISVLLGAGINIWMLTGDKLETAINIGYSTQLLSKGMPLIILSVGNVEELHAKIHSHSILLGDNLGKPGNNIALVINGGSLQLLFDSKYRDEFVLLSVSCRSVICCRCTPLQKAQVIQCVSRKSKAVTLAIGDGANDVAMIQEATIGIGISGVEGLQAAQAADYSIGQFKYLKKLLLVHGAWNYTRICCLIYFCFYKNFLLTIIQLYYTIASGWSGQIIFDQWTLLFYNVFFTSAPLLVLGLFEQTFNKCALLKYPTLYLLNDWFSMKVFALCLLNAFLHALLIMWLSFTILKNDVLWENGHSANYLIQGNTIYTILILVTCAKFVIISQYWTMFTLLGVMFSVLSWVTILFILSFTFPLLPVAENMRNIILMMVTSPIIILTIFSVTFFVIFVDWFILTIVRTFSNPLELSLEKYTTLSMKTIDGKKYKPTSTSYTPSPSPSNSVSNTRIDPEPESSEVVFYFINKDKELKAERLSSRLFM